MEVLEKFIAILKLPLKFIFTLAVVLGLVLFLPTTMIEKLKIDSFIDSYGKFIGIIFLISVGYLFVNLLLWCVKKIRICNANRKFKNNIQNVLQNLPKPDVYLLREFVLQGKDVIEVPIENSEFISLYNKNILHVASNNVRAFVFGSFVSVTINPIVKKYITNDILDLPNSKPTKQDLENIKNNRPDYLSSLNYVNGLINRIGHF